MGGLTPALIGIGGVIFGVLLRPIIEEIFRRRRNSLYLELEKKQVGFLPPKGSSLSLTLNENKIDRIVARDFRIINRTGQTVRDLVLFLSFEYSSGIAERHCWIELYQTDDAEFSPDKPDVAWFKFIFARLDRGAVVKGQLLSTYIGKVKGYTDSGYEVFIGDRGSFFHPKELMITFLPFMIGLSVSLVGYIWRHL